MILFPGLLMHPLCLLHPTCQDRGCEGLCCPTHRVKNPTQLCLSPGPCHLLTWYGSNPPHPSPALRKQSSSSAVPGVGCHGDVRCTRLLEGYRCHGYVVAVPGRGRDETSGKLFTLKGWASQRPQLSEQEGKAEAFLMGQNLVPMGNQERKAH